MMAGMATEFEHELVTGRVVFAPGAVARVPDEVERLGARRVLLIGGGHDVALLDRVAGDLGERIRGRIGEVVQHVPIASVTAATDQARALDADLLLCVGGGSATGLAKAVALRTGLRILAVPTTYAGSEMSPIWGVTGDDGKVTGRDSAALPVVVVYDPGLTVGLPAGLSVVSGLNALAHAAEGVYAPAVSPVVRLVAQEAARALARGIARVGAAPTDAGVRSDLLYGAFLAGVTLGNAAMGLHHKVCHVLGGSHDLPHAETHAVLLPYSLAHNRGAPGLDLLAAALGGDDAATAVRDLGTAAGAPASLVALGFDPAGTGKVARVVADADFPNPRPVTFEGVRALLAKACDGAQP